MVLQSPTLNQYFRRRFMKKLSIWAVLSILGILVILALTLGSSAALDEPTEGDYDARHELTEGMAFDPSEAQTVAEDKLR